ncbi:MAG TPA: gliding motility-associated C-terminal domain-containing protein [Chitinophagaceae bacterium]|nr:gliding motility-associated C-terminal domain-containing protein [Chitinophagaceae bacterium]
MCLLLHPCKQLHAQLCAGSLGDTAISETFDKNSLPPNYNSYKEVYDCPGPGEFVLTNFIFGCGNKTWPPTAGDHTRLVSHNAHSNEMLLNAAGKPGIIYQRTADGFCGDITYQFSAFVTNMMWPRACGGQPVLPNLTFSVTDASGAINATYSTGDIKIDSIGVDWKQYGLFFTTPDSPTPVTFKITSNAIGGCGAAFAIDDITVRPCGTRVSVTLDDDTVSAVDVCEGFTNPLLLKASYLGFTNPKTTWQNSLDSGQTWQDIAGAVTTTYKAPRTKPGTAVMYRIIVAEAVNFNSPKCRIASNPVWIGVHSASPPVPLTHGSACLDKDYTMPYVAGGSNYIWTGPNGFYSISLQPIVPAIQYSDTGLYKVKAITDFGCITIDSVYITVSPSVTLSVTKNYAVCEGSPLQFDASGGGTYLWTPAAGLSSTTIPNPTLLAKDSAKYQVLIENEYGCRDSAIVEVDVYRRITLSAGPDKYIQAGDTATLTPAITGTAVSYYWTPGIYMNDAAAFNPKVHPPLGDMIYTLHAQSGPGCGNGTDDVTVHVYDNMYIPNAFTPNNDGHNDVFRILPFDNYTLNHFIIYNRWGKAVFSTTNPGEGWDGRFNQQPQPPGTYVYYLEMTAKDGRKITRRGTVVLIR